MSDQAINYEAVLADLENRKAQLEAAIAGIRLVMGQPGTSPSGGPSGGGSSYAGSAPAHDATFDAPITMGQISKQPTT